MATTTSASSPRASPTSAGADCCADQHRTPAAQAGWSPEAGGRGDHLAAHRPKIRNFDRTDSWNGNCAWTSGQTWPLRPVPQPRKWNGPAETPSITGAAIRACAACFRSVGSPSAVSRDQALAFAELATVIIDTIRRYADLLTINGGPGAPIPHSNLRGQLTEAQGRRR
jgi:hypothetical protein